MKRTHKAKIRAMQLRQRALAVVKHDRAELTEFQARHELRETLATSQTFLRVALIGAMWELAQEQLTRAKLRLAWLGGSLGH